MFTQKLENPVWFSPESDLFLACDLPLQICKMIKKTRNFVDGIGFSQDPVHFDLFPGQFEHFDCINLMILPF